MNGLSNIDELFSTTLDATKYQDEAEKSIISTISDILEEELTSGSWDIEDSLDNIKYGENKVSEYLPRFYNKYGHELKFVFDQSLTNGIEFSPKTYVVSLSKGIEMISDFYKEFDQQDYFHMNDKTSIHINIGLNHPVSWNIVKGLVMLNDRTTKETPFVYKGMENRSETKYTKSLLSFLDKYYKENKPTKFDARSIEYDIMELIKTEIELVGVKNYAFNVDYILKRNYAEFRYPGGKITKDLLIDKLMFFCYIVHLMTTDYKRADYHKKLYKQVMQK